MTRTTAAVAAAVVTGAVVTATAGAASAAPAGAAPRSAVSPDGRVALVDASSIAGYSADLSHFSLSRQWKATATFTVPTVRCTTKTTNILYVELFFNGLDRHGAYLGEGGYAAIGCTGTTPTYSLNLSAQGAATGGVDVPTAAGDSVTVSFAATTRSEVSTVTDTTTGATGSQTGTGFASVGGMQVSVQGGDAHSVFPRFSRVHFTSVFGAGIGIQGLNPGRFDANDADGNVKIAAGPLDGNGRGFTDTFVANFTPSP